MARIDIEDKKNSLGSDYTFGGVFKDIDAMNEDDIYPVIENDRVTGILNNSKYYVDYSEANQGVTGSGRSLKDLITAIGSNNSIIIFENVYGNEYTEYTLDTDIVIPANIKLKFQNGAYINIGTGIKLYILGEVESDYKIFESVDSLPVVFNSEGLPGKQHEIKAVWFGVIADNGTTDNGLYLKQFFNSLSTYHIDTSYFKASAKGILPAGEIHFSTAVTAGGGAGDYYYGMHIEGAKAANFSGNPGTSVFSGGTRLHYTGSGVAITLGSSDHSTLASGELIYGLTIRNMWISGTSSATGGLKAKFSGLTMDGVCISGFSNSGYYGLQLNGITGHVKDSTICYNDSGIWMWGNAIHIDNCDIHHNTVGGAIVWGENNSFSKNTIQSNGDFGIALDSHSKTSQITGIVIDNNYFEGNGEGVIEGQIYLFGIVSSTIDNCVIKHNLFSNAGDALARHIYCVEYVDGLTVVDNVWRNTTNELIHFNTANANFWNLKIYGNAPYNNTKTSDYQLTYSYSGCSFNNDGDVDAIIFTLERALQGLEYEFSKLVDQDLKLQCGAGDVINDGTAGKAYENTSAEGNIAICKIKCYKTGYWQVITTGTWANNNT